MPNPFGAHGGDLRIAMIAPPFVAVPPVRYGGTELVLGALVEGLAARGHQVTLYASGDSTASGELRAYFERAVWPPDAHFELVQAATAAWDLLERRDVDLVHAHTASALAFAPLLRCPMIYTVHHDLLEGCNALMRAAGGRAALTCVAISHRQRLRLEGIPAEVIHHGLPPSRYAPGSGKGGYAAFLGRFAREKGVVDALDAARAAEVPLHLAGCPHPADAGYYRDEVAPRMGAPGIRWFGEVGHESKVRLLGNAFATLFPVEWEEPFGLVMIESMLCGTPVIAYGRGSVPEVVEEGVTGFIVDSVAALAARLRQLRGSPFDRNRCRAAAIARFGSERMVSAYLGLYGAAVAHASASEEAL